MVAGIITIISFIIMLLNMNEDENIVDVEHVSECISENYCMLLVFKNQFEITELLLDETHFNLIFENIASNYDDPNNKFMLYLKYEGYYMPKYYSKIFCYVQFSDFSTFECTIEGIMPYYDRSANNHKIVCTSVNSSKLDSNKNNLRKILSVKNHKDRIIRKSFVCITKNISDDGFDVNCFLIKYGFDKSATIKVKFNNKYDVDGNILNGTMPDSFRISVKITKNLLKDLNYDIFTLDFKWNQHQIHGDFAMPPRFLRNAILVPDHGYNITSFTNISLNLTYVYFSTMRVKINKYAGSNVTQVSHDKYLEAFIIHEAKDEVCAFIVSDFITSILAYTYIIVHENFSKPELSYLYDNYLEYSDYCDHTEFEAMVIKVTMELDYLKSFTFHFHTDDSRYVLDFKTVNTFFDKFDIYVTHCQNQNLRKYNITIHARKYNLTKDDFFFFKIFVYYWDKYFKTIAMYLVKWSHKGDSFTLKLYDSKAIKSLTDALNKMLLDEQCSDFIIKYGIAKNKNDTFNETTITELLQSYPNISKIESQCEKLKLIFTLKWMSQNFFNIIHPKKYTQISLQKEYIEIPKIKTDLSFVSKDDFSDKIKELTNKMVKATSYTLLAKRYDVFVSLIMNVYRKGKQEIYKNVTIFLQTESIIYFHSNLTNTDQIIGSFSDFFITKNLKTKIFNISVDMIESSLSRNITVAIEEYNFSSVNCIIFKHYSSDIDENTFHVHILRKDINATSEVTCVYENKKGISLQELTCSCFEFPCLFMFSYNKKISITFITSSFWFWSQTITILTSIGIFLKIIFFDRNFQHHKLFNHIRTLGVCFTFVYIFFIVKEIYKTSTQQEYFVLALLHRYFTISTYLKLLSIIFEQYMNISEEIYVKYNCQWISIVLPWVIAFIWIVPTSILIYKNHQDSFISHSIRDRCIILPIFLLVLGIYIFLLIRKKNKKKLVTYEAFTNVTNKQIKMALLFLMSLLTIGWIFQFMIGLTDIFIEISQICNCAHGIALFVGLQFKTFHIKKLKILTKN